MKIRSVALILLCGVLTIGFLAVLITSWGSTFNHLKQEYANSYRDSFVKSFESSFVQSCTEDDSTASQKSLCECVATRATKDLSVDQLKDVNYTAKYISTTLFPACRASSDASINGSGTASERSPSKQSDSNDE